VPDASVSSPKVLIVEDDPLLALDLMALLERAGFQVLGVAESGEQALVLVRVRPVDVVVMDVDLSEGGGRLDGVQTATQIVESSTASVVFVTGEPPADVDRRCRSIGGARVISKPYDDNTLVTAVRRAV
jgi:CheY-like chemotaxis protein